MIPFGFWRAFTSAASHRSRRVSDFSGLTSKYIHVFDTALIMAADTISGCYIQPYGIGCISPGDFLASLHSTIPDAVIGSVRWAR